MKAPSTTPRTSPLHGMSVRETAQAIGKAKMIASTVTPTP